MRSSFIAQSKAIRRCPLWLACLLLSWMLSSPLLAQLARYPFDGSIEDAVQDYHPDYTFDQIVTDPALVSYVDGVEGQAVHLGKREGIFLPDGVTDALFGSDVWVFRMRFRITDFGDGDGERTLISLKRSGTSTPPYFRLTTSRLSDTECRLVFRMENGQTTLVRNACTFDLGEWVDLTFTIDFKERFYSITTGDYFLSVIFDEFDYARFKTYGGDNSLQEKRFYIGYYQNLNQNHNSTDARYNVDMSAEMEIDELSVYNEHLSSDASILETSLQRLTQHLNGVITLTSEEILSEASAALTNIRGNYPGSKAVVDAYMTAYEAVYEPMFIHEGPVDFYAAYDPFGWVLLNLQLDILDHYTTTGNIDLIEGLVFETHEAFPGPVAASATRLEHHPILINGTYVADPGYNIKIKQPDYGTFARRGTGLYAPPGERITVEVPEALVGIGAEVVIGSHTDDVSGKMDKLRRFPRVVKSFPIDGSTVVAASPLGGAIYITIPEGTTLGTQQLTVSGAVRFAYYPKNAANPSGDIADFQMRVQSAEVLWAEVETDNFMFTGPLAFFKRDDIEETVQTWDNMWAAYQMVFGRPYPRHNAEHLVIDRMSKWNTLAGGYPMVLTWGNAPHTPDFWALAGANMMNILDFQYAIQDDKVTYWHEMSHHNGLPTLPGERECIVELAYVVAFHLGYGMPLEDAFKYSEREQRSRNDAIIDWVITDNFMNNAEMAQVQRQYQHRGYSKYVDVGVLFGWEALGRINKVFYDYWASIGGQANDPEEEIITDTEWILASCETLNANVAPLYHFWGEQPAPEILDQVNSYPRSPEVYRRLREIRDLIPRSTAEYQPYFDAHAPTNIVNEYHAALADWAGYRTKILREIDFILETYYGSDFDEDGIPFQIDGDDTDPAVGLTMGDVDGDGESALAEYALGGDFSNAQQRPVSPQLVRTDADLCFEHLRRRNDPRITYTIQTNDSLTPDNWVDTMLEELEAISHDPDFDKVIYRVPIDRERRFIRLKVRYP